MKYIINFITLPICLLLALPAHGAINKAKIENINNHTDWFLPMEDLEPSLLSKWVNKWRGKGSENQVVKTYPLAILIEHNNAGHPDSWMPWLTQNGVAVAVVHSAAARGRISWIGTGCSLKYGQDARLVVEAAKANEKIDTSKVAIFGFSRGGTEALNTNGYFSDSKKKPDAVFSFYPGCGGWCKTDYDGNGSTDVNILYGNDDDWGKWRDSYGHCKSLAGGKIKFHGIPQATHAFDYLQGSGTYEITGAGTFAWRASPSGLAMARQIVAETLNRKWQTTIK